MEEQLTAKIIRTKMSGNISPQIPSVEAEEPKEVAKVIEEDHSKGVPENDLEGITKGETFSGNDLTSLKKVEHVEESKEDSCEGVVTTDMLKEEENLENEGRKEEGKFKEEQQKTQAETSDQKNSTDERRSHRTKNSMYSSPSSSQDRVLEITATLQVYSTSLRSSTLAGPPPTAKRKKRDPDPQNSTASEGDNVNQESELINSSTTTQHSKSIADGLSKEEQANSDTEEMLIEETEKKALLEKNDEHPVLFTGGSLRQYQKEGYKWLRTSYENGVNGILADEMGLGKTVQCIAMLAHLIYQGVTGPFLVVAPLSTLPNWYSEFRRFTPKVPVILYHGTPDERTRLRIQIRKTTPIREGVNVQPVVITSYEITMRDRTSLQSHDWKILIVDEGHRIKNTHCRLIRELRMYGNTHRLLLTGTPLQNNLAELWSLLNFLLPEIFDDLGSFEMWFDVERLSLENAEEKIVKEEQQKNILSMLHQILTPFMLRRLKQDVELKLPPKKELLVYAPMSSLQQEYYTSTVDKTIMDKIQEKCKEPEFIEYDSNGRPVRKSRKKTVNYSLLDEKDDGCSDSDLEEDLEKWFNVVQDSSASYTAKEKVPAKSVVTIRMQNIMMQLRKCCNHPYLLEYPLTESGDYKIDEDLVQTCGKMKLLDAMLAELKLRKHKVILSQLKSKSQASSKVRILLQQN
uniref:Lymphoid-specific helicase n=1 Tax=Magallana gigas TaxID=29159 RepID=K1RZF1_MAGGI